MAIATHKGAISFGLVHIPIAMYKATQEERISFNQLHAGCGARIKQKKFCPVHDQEVSGDEIIKGYQYEKDKYITMTKEEIEDLKTEKDKTIQIKLFTDCGNISPIYYKQAYYATPEAGGDKAYDLLRTAMQEENKVAIATTVMGESETLLSILPTDEGLMMETMYFQAEVRPIPKTYQKQTPAEQELQMAKDLLKSMEKSFLPSEYKNEYQERLRIAIEKKILGEKIIVVPQQQEGDIGDLMEALQLSVKQQEEKSTI